MLKLAQTNQQTNQPTNRPTNRQGKNNMSPTTTLRVPAIDREKQKKNIINILTKFHKDWMKTFLTPNFININILTKFHEDWMKTVTSTVYTNKLLTDTRTHTRTY
ncbi:hypothetical protein DPMN_005571 [Dreissena polymorpha]|uniref:Uncharacterized protein n=1 Tax=Dreissena polymorpha TaxID=45954 RepID=A0A9D4MQM1_DREPO|nr:hypothetical protein DPMN_005571 [Dreissena polymorpha]